MGGVRGGESYVAMPRWMGFGAIVVMVVVALIAVAGIVSLGGRIRAVEGRVASTARAVGDIEDLSARIENLAGRIDAARADSGAVRRLGARITSLTDDPPEVSFASMTTAAREAITTRVADHYGVTVASLTSANWRTTHSTAIQGLNIASILKHSGTREFVRLVVIQGRFDTAAPPSVWIERFSFTSPFAAAGALPLGVGEAPSPGHWQVFLSYLLCYLLMNSLMLWSMLWLFNVRWRVRS